MSTSLLFLSAFCQPCKSTTGKMVPKLGGFQFYFVDLIWLPLSVHICLGLVVEYWPFVSACTSHIASYSINSSYYLCLPSSLFKFLPPPTSPPVHPSAHPLINTGPILINSLKKIIKNWWKLAIIYLPG